MAHKIAETVYTCMLINDNWGIKIMADKITETVDTFVLINGNLRDKKDGWQNNRSSRYMHPFQW